MVGDDFLFGLMDEFVFLFEATDNAVESLVKVVHIDCLFVFTCGDECCFVANVGDVGTCETGCHLSQSRWLDIE